MPRAAPDKGILMERRQFIGGLFSSVAAWPPAARAQRSTQRQIGVLGADATVWRPWIAAFGARLRELGWIEGETLATEYRWAEGSSERVSEVAAEFLRQDVDVSVTYGTAVTILKRAWTCRDLWRHRDCQQAVSRSVK